MCLGFFRSEATSSHITFVFHPPGQVGFKELARTSGPNIGRDAFLFLVHPEWRKSHSPPRPITLFASRCHYTAQRDSLEWGKCFSPLDVTVLGGCSEGQGKEGTGTEIIAETVDNSLINEIGRDSKYRVT